MDDHKWRGAERAERQASRRALSPPAGGGRIDGSMASPAPDLSVETTRRELQARVLGFVSRRVRSREDAEDIAQEVMLRIHRHSADLERVERMGAWVHRIAANAIADHYRRPARRELPSGQAGDVPEAAAEPALDEPDTDALRLELASCLAPLLEHLPPIYREALELTEFGGVSQVEAAERLGLSVSGMKARVQRARGQLRALLLDCCHVELDRRRSVTEIQPLRGPCGTCGAS
jgi:RNA polymerase sigma-70 factor (ECF subfamily)